eukprot:Partr_v1_DN28591_c1_g1_i4_m73051 putative Exocyst complex component
MDAYLSTSAAFDEREFVAKFINSTSVESIKHHFSTLQSSKSGLTLDMQRNVFSNYNQFISVAKEISMLDKDLLELKDILIAMRSLVFADSVESEEDQLLLAEFNLMTPEQGRKRQQSLVAQISDLAKFHSDPQRYLIKEGAGLMVVDDSSAKQSSQAGKSVHLFLYNDLLVLGYRKKSGLTKSRVAVERDWLLDSLTVVAADSSKDESLSFMIIVNSETIHFRADSAELKRLWMLTIKRAADAWRKSLASKAVTVHEVEPHAFLTSANDLTILKSTLKPNRKKDNLNPDLSWIGNMPDELDVFIAHREFDNAIKCIERANSIFAQYPDVVADSSKSALAFRVDALASLLAKDLQFKSSAKSIQRLCRLGLSSRARDIFLGSQTQIIQSSIAALSFDGDVVLYIHDLTYLFFSLLKRSVKQYRRFFTDLELSSGLITWLNSELDTYWVRFRCQVFHEEQSFDIIGECLESAREGCVVLKDVGVDIGHVFEVGAVRKDVVVSMEWLRAKICAELSKSIADDEFTSFCEVPSVSCRRFVDSAAAEGEILTIADSQASSSAVTFSNSVIMFMLVDLKSLLNPSVAQTYYTEVTDAVISMYEMYFRHVLDLSHGQEFGGHQLVVAVVSMTFLSQALFEFINNIMISSGELVVPAVKNSPARVCLVGFRRPIPEWVKMRKRVDAMIALMISSFILKRAKQAATTWYTSAGRVLVDRTSSFRPMDLSVDYTEDKSPVTDALSPTDSVTECIRRLALLRDEFKDAFAMAKSVPTGFSINSMLEEAVDTILRDLNGDAVWSDNDLEPQIGYSGIHKFILDIHFFMKIVDKYLTPASKKYADDVSGKALKLYFKGCTTDDKKKRVLKGIDWYEARALHAMQIKKLQLL